IDRGFNDVIRPRLPEEGEFGMPGVEDERFESRLRCDGNGECQRDTRKENGARLSKVKRHGSRLTESRTGHELNLPPGRRGGIARQGVLNVCGVYLSGKFSSSIDLQFRYGFTTTIVPLPVGHWQHAKRNSLRKA